MAIYLAQHGQAFTEEADPQRPLTNLGIKETAHIASVAEYYMINIDQIHHSSKLRSRQTAEVFALKLKPTRGLHENPDLEPNGDFKKIAGTLKTADNLLLVGHLPLLQRLLSQMVTGNPDFEIVRFQNSGLVCLDMAPDGRKWQIRWTLSKHIS